MIEYHVMHKKNKYIVFHPESLSLFLVSADIGKILEQYESKAINRNQITNNTDYLDDKISMIFVYLENKIKDKISKDLKWSNKEPKTLCLFISQDCNLRCSYCFANHGAFGGMEKLMTIDIAKKSIDKLLSKSSNNFVEFFGGEPFLNFPLMKEVEEYGRKTGLEIKYTTITNGTIMNDAIEKFIIDNLFYLCISLDGPKEINDSQRFGNIGSVHDMAEATIKRLNSKRTPLAIKCTATKKSIRTLGDIAEYISSFGVKSMAFAPVARIPQESELYISDREFEIYADKLSKIAVKILNQLALGNVTTSVSPIFRILSQLVTKTRMVHHCSAGREYIAVTADGDVYPCHEFVGIEEFKMGNVNDEDFPGETYNRIKNIFDNHSVYAFDECKACWARFLCGGDCAVRSHIYNGDLFKPTKRKCILIKSILEALLPEIVDIFQDENKTQNILKRFNEFKSRDTSPNLLQI